MNGKLIALRTFCGKGLYRLEKLYATLGNAAIRAASVPIICMLARTKKIPEMRWR